MSSNDDWSKLYNLAENYQKQEQWQEAANSFYQAIQLRPDFFWSYHHLGDTLTRLQRWDKAVLVYRRAVEINPDFFWSWHNLGDTLTKLQQWDEAVLVYRRAVEIDPDFFWSWHNLGDALTKLQQWDKAVLVYRRAVEIDPNFFWSWHNLGDALTKLQQWDKAIAVYLQALILESDRQVLYQKLGTVFKQRGSLKDSIRDYRQLIQSDNSDNIYRYLKTNPETSIAIAKNLVVEHQNNAAIVLYYMALEIQSDRSPLLLKLAELLQQQNQLQQDIASRQSTLQSELLTRQQTSIIAQPQPQDIPGEIIIKYNCSISPEQLEDLFSMVGWSRRPLDKVKRSLDRSFGYVAAWHIYEEKESLIGFARAVSDGVFHATLLDILIDPHFQHRGWGKKIVLALIEQLQNSHIRDITLFASPHIVDFYHKLGFISQPNNLQWMLWSGDPINFR